MLGCTPKAYNACTCPALRTKKEEPGVSKRDISGLMHWEAYMSEARSWSGTPLYAADTGQEKAAGFTPGGREDYHGEMTSGGLISYQGNQ